MQSNKIEKKKPIIHYAGPLYKCFTHLHFFFKPARRQQPPVWFWGKIKQFEGQGVNRWIMREHDFVFQYFMLQGRWPWKLDWKNNHNFGKSAKTVKNSGIHVPLYTLTKKVFVYTFILCTTTTVYLIGMYILNRQIQNGNCETHVKSYIISNYLLLL